MFLVSWSLFSRLSRMKDSVSSSWGSAGRASPAARAEDHRAAGPRPGRRAQLRAGSAPLTPASPRTGRRGAVSGPGLPCCRVPSPSPPASACPQFPAAGRTPPAGGSSLRPRGSHSRGFVSASAFSASVSVTPTSALGPAPSAPQAACGVWQAEVPLRRALGRAAAGGHLGCGGKGGSATARPGGGLQHFTVLNSTQPGKRTANVLL